MQHVVPAFQQVGDLESGLLPEDIQGVAAASLAHGGGAGTEDEELFPCPGKGHIELVEQFHGLPQQGFVVDPAAMRAVLADHAQAVFLHEHRVARLQGGIGPGQEDHRGLEALGFVDGHDANGVDAFRHGDFFLLALFLPVGQEVGQGGQSLILGILEHFEEAAQEDIGIGIAFEDLQAVIPFHDRVVGRHEPGLIVERRQDGGPEAGEVPLQMLHQGDAAPVHATVVQGLKVGDRQGALLHQTARDHGPEGQLVFRVAQEL